MRALRAVLGAVMLVGACGDPAVDGSYEGQARFEARGLVCAIGKMDSPTTAIGVVWTTLAPDATRLDTISGEAHPIDASALPADFELGLFDLPPKGTTTPIRGYNGVHDVAIGIPVLFEDLDANGSLDPELEPVLGVSRGQLVLYTGTAGSTSTADVSLAVERMPRGWSSAKAVCDDNQALIGLQLLPDDTRFDVWLFDGVIDNPLESLAPKTCLLPF